MGTPQAAENWRLNSTGEDIELRFGADVSSGVKGRPLNARDSNVGTPVQRSASVPVTLANGGDSPPSHFSIQSST